MSQFKKTVVAPVAGRATVAWFTNIYRAADGSIEPGARNFRSKANAERKARSTRPGRGLVYLKTIEVSHTHP